MTDSNRMKATDVFAASRSFLGKGTFAQAFPLASKITVDVKEKSFGELLSSKTYTNPGEYINCSNPRCYKGGVRVAQLLRQMIENEESSKSWSNIFCQGYEGSPKGRKKYDDCEHRFEIHVNIDYLNNPTQCRDADAVK